MLGISTSASALQSVRQLSIAHSDYNTLTERLSSGLRINSGADDAAGLSISQSHTTQITGAIQAQLNVADAISFLEVTDSTLAEMADIYERGRTMAVHSATGTLSQEQRDLISIDYFHALNSTLENLSEKTKYNGLSLIDGTTPPTGITFQIGANQTDTLTVFGTDLRPDGFYDSLSGHFEVSSIAYARDEIDTIDQTLEHLNAFRTEIGASINRLNTVMAGLMQNEEKLTIAKGRVIDADFATETMKLAQNEIHKKSGLNMLVRANEQRESILNIINA